MEQRQNYAFFKKYTKSEYYAKSKKQKFCKIPFAQIPPHIKNINKRSVIKKCR